MQVLTLNVAILSQFADKPLHRWQWLRREHSDDMHRLLRPCASRPQGRCATEQESSDAELREYIYRGMKERWLFDVVRRLNTLEQRPATHNLGQCALRRLGFPVSG
jgi:hypothetical protein